MVDFKKLKEHVATVNSVCGVTIRVVGVKKEATIDEFKKVVTSNIDKLSADVIEFYNSIVAEPAPEKPAPAITITPLGNTETILMEHVAVLNSVEGVSIVTDDKSLQEIEDLMIEALDSLTEDLWSSLPVDTQKWDADMTEKIKLANSEKAAAKEGKPKKEKSADKPKKEKSADKPKKEKSAPVGPRPDFKFTEGTSSYAIMDIFGKIFSKSEGEGVKMKDLQDAAIAAKIKSNNIKGRVNITVRYAMTPEGGGQIVKVGDLLYPKGKQPTK